MSPYQKDRLLVRIVLKLIGREYIRGYLTAASAKKDIKRLDDHLQTKPIGSFKKHTMICCLVWREGRHSLSGQR
jgi:hypothetical protein